MLLKNFITLNFSNLNNNDEIHYIGYRGGQKRVTAMIIKIAFDALTGNLKEWFVVGEPDKSVAKITGNDKSWMKNW